MNLLDRLIRNNSIGLLEEMASLMEEVGSCQNVGKYDVQCQDDFSTAYMCRCKFEVRGRAYEVANPPGNINCCRPSNMPIRSLKHSR